MEKNFIKNYKTPRANRNVMRKPVKSSCSFLNDIQLLQESITKSQDGKITAEYIADVMLNRWSEKTFRNVENLILKKAIKEGYFEEYQLQLVKIFDDRMEFPENINNTTTITYIIWNIFNMKEHFDRVKSHRYWILESYERLKSFLSPELDYDIIVRHDLSKYAFSQAIGYTLRWVWAVDPDNPLWVAARDLHLFNEPHHPQLWCVSPNEKRNRINFWLTPRRGEAREDEKFINHDFTKHREMPTPFLHESFIDIVACEWERKKTGNKLLSNKDLVSLSGNFITRYNNEQGVKIDELIKNISVS